MRALIAFCVVLANTHYLNAQNPTVISDSLVVQQRLYAKEKLVVDQEARFKQDVIVKGDLKAKSDVRIDSLLKVDGTTRLLGSVKMEGLGTATTITSETEILLIMPNGNIIRGDIDGMLNAFANPQGITTDYCTANGGIAKWWAVAQKLFTACPDVNVGIRTDDPQFALHTVGTTYSKSFLAGSTFGSTNAYFNVIGLSNAATLMNLGVKLGVSPEEIRFTVSGYGEVKITNTGTQPSLLINNGKGHAIVVHANDGNKILQLEDDGLLRAREIRVDQDTWADHVFDDDYHLPKLGDVAQFIKVNHHLPGVPSAEQIDQDGLNLGEMQKIQMQKIEEMTLYLIEMEKNMAKMETRITELEKENASLKHQK
ncbi:MAG: hypothetical protein IPH66_13310 [Crocinitomicaceae bacterium]|nr:hypothetical protein [Crocinitomicaceae bacterium]